LKSFQKMNNFYQQHKAYQWIEAIILLLTGVLPALFVIEKGYEQPLFYVLFLIYVPIVQFTSAPLLTLVGMYTYYAPMLLGYKANDVQIDLHSGGSFDCLFVNVVKLSSVTLCLLFSIWLTLCFSCIFLF
jgi:hypothetical protein